MFHIFEESAKAKQWKKGGKVPKPKSGKLKPRQQEGDSDGGGKGSGGSDGKDGPPSSDGKGETPLSPKEATTEQTTPVRSSQCIVRKYWKFQTCGNFLSDFAKRSVNRGRRWAQI